MDKPAGIILSAGFSSRMKSFKPLITYSNIPFLLSVILKLAKVCENIVIVTGFRGEELRKKILSWFNRDPEIEDSLLNSFTTTEWLKLPSRIHFVYNPKYKSGMFCSLQCGLRYLRNSNWILLHFVDQPHLPIKFYLQFVKQISLRYDWIQPVYQNQKAHPILLKQSVSKKIIEAASNSTLHQISQQPEFNKKYWECDIPQVLIDFDSREDISKNEYINGNPSKNN